MMGDLSFQNRIRFLLMAVVMIQVSCCFEQSAWGQKGSDIGNLSDYVGKNAKPQAAPEPEFKEKDNSERVVLDARTKGVHDALKSCSKAVKQKGNDVFNRNLSEKLDENVCSSVQSPLSEQSKNIINTVAQGVKPKPNMRDLFKKVASTDSFRSVMAIWSNAVRTGALKNLSKADAIALVCKQNGKRVYSSGCGPGMGDSGGYLDKAFEAFKAVEQKHATPQVGKRDIDQMNALIQKLNVSCRNAQKEATQARKEVDANTDLVGGYGGVRPSADNFHQVAVNQMIQVKGAVSYVPLAAAWKEQEELLDQIYTGPLGRLMMVDEFREGVGDKPLPKGQVGCRTFHPVTPEMYSKANVKFSALLSDSYQTAQYNFKKADDPQDPTFSGRTIKKYLKTNPGLVGDVLASSGNQDDATLLCGVIKDVAWGDVVEQVGNRVLLAAGVIVGAAVAVAVPGAALLEYAIAGTGLVTGLGAFANAQQETRLTHYAGATGEIKMKEAVENLNELDEKKKEELIKIGMSAVPFIMGGTIKAIEAGHFASTVTNEARAGRMMMRMSDAEEETRVYANAVKTLQKNPTFMESVNEVKVVASGAKHGEFAHTVTEGGHLAHDALEGGEILTGLRVAEKIEEGAGKIRTVNEAREGAQEFAKNIESKGKAETPEGAVDEETYGKYVAAFVKADTATQVRMQSQLLHKTPEEIAAIMKSTVEASNANVENAR